MDLRLYVPISKYLTESDVNPRHASCKNIFTFKFKNNYHESESFFVYKSLACFLSNKAYHQLIKNISFLDISYNSSQLSPKQVITELLNLLSGKPILIQQNNFQFFQKIFHLLDNRDFDCFFGSKSPESPTEFYLSLYFLETIPSGLIESSQVQIPNISDCFIPKGLFNLFWKHTSNSKKVSFPN
jgi:hypothetical protein